MTPQPPGIAGLPGQGWRLPLSIIPYRGTMTWMAAAGRDPGGGRRQNPPCTEGPA
jgi:hypothetical protein